MREMEKVFNKHEQLRNVLIKYKCEEFGDCIIDDICKVFKYPTTEIYDVEILKCILKEMEK